MSTATLSPPISRAATNPASAKLGLLARFQYPILAGLLAAFLVIGWQGRQPTSIGGGDELIYLSLSQSLETGSYREVYRPTAPLHVQYPPAYPAWLVPIRHLAGSSLDLIRLSNLILVGLGIFLMFTATRRLAGPTIALALVALLALNPGILLVGGSMMSEGPYILLSALALVLMLRPEPANNRSDFVLIAIALLTFLTRIIGLALVVAVGFWLWSQRRRIALFAWAVASTLVVGGWFVYSHFARADASVRSYLPDLSGGVAFSDGLLTEVAHRVWHNGVQYATADMPLALALPTISNTLVDNWIWLVATAILLPVGFFILYRKWSGAAAYLICYVSIVLVWTWQDGRLLYPILPLGLLAFLLGIQWAAGFLPRPARKPAMAATWGLAAFGALHGADNRIAQFQRCDRAAPPSTSGCYDPDNAAMAAAADYVKLHGAPGDAVLSVKPFSINFLSGHPAEEARILLAIPPGTAADTMLAHKIRFVIVGRTFPGLMKIILNSCRGFHVEADLLPQALLLSARPPQDVSPDACEALRKMKPVLPPGWKWDEL